MRRDLQSGSPAGKLMKTTVIDADAERMTIEVEFTVGSEFTNRIGTVAGGFISAMMDSVTGLAGLSILPEGEMAMHRTLSVEYLRPGRPGRFVGRGRVIEHEGRDIRSEGELVDESGEVVARGEASLRIIEKHAK